MMNKGISLFEIIIVLAILGISLSLSIPTFSTTLANYRLKSAILILEKDLRFAKNKSNQTKQRVSMCISIDHMNCISDNSYDWHQGWIVFIDSNNSFKPLPSNILKIQEPFHSSIKIMSSRNIQHGVQFNSGRKFGRGLGTGLANGYFIICNQYLNGHKLTLNIYGRLRQEQSNNDC